MKGIAQEDSPRIMSLNKYIQTSTCKILLVASMHDDALLDDASSDILLGSSSKNTKILNISN